MGGGEHWCHPITGSLEILEHDQPTPTDAADVFGNLNHIFRLPQNTISLSIIIEHTNTHSRFHTNPLTTLSLETGRPWERRSPK